MKTIKLRLLIYFVLVGIVIFLTSYFLINKNKNEIDKQLFQNQVKVNKLLSQETDIFFSGINSDLNYIKNIIERSKNMTIVSDFIELFLLSHPKYFKFRIIAEDGQEIFKIVQDRNGQIIKKTENYNAQNEDYFRKLKKLNFEQNYISNFDYYREKGKISLPLRPTVRFARKAFFNGKIVFLILNLEAKVLIQEFINSLINETELSVNIVNSKGAVILTSEDGFSTKYIDKHRKTKFDISSFVKDRKVNEFYETKSKEGNFTIWLMSAMFAKDHIFEDKYFIYSFSKNADSTEQVKTFQNLVIYVALIIYLIMMFLLYKFEMRKLDLATSQEIIKDQEQFIANVSHQLRTPLTLMLMEISASEKESPQSSLLKSLKEEVHYLVKVVNNLLILSKLNTGKEVFLFREVSLDEIIIYIISRLTILAKEKNIKINFNIHSLPNKPFKGDEELLRCMIENVLENAIKYSENNSLIEVELNHQDQKVIIKIKDYGKGIKPENTDKIFNYFFRENNDIKGSGLGLTLAKRVAKLHHGNLYYRKNINENGSSFYIELGMI